MSQFFAQAAIRRHPINCVVRSNMTHLGWFLEYWCGLGSQCYGVFLGSLMSWQLLRNLPGALGEISSKLQSEHSVYLSEELLCLHLAEYPQVTVMAQELWVGNDLFSLLEIKNVIASLCHTVLKTSLVWFKSTFGNQCWFQVAEGRCLWTQTGSVHPENCCQGSGCGKCSPAQPWGCVCMDWGLSVWYRSTSWRAIRGPQGLIISADQNYSGALKNSHSHLFHSKHSAYKAGSSRLG